MSKPIVITSAPAQKLVVDLVGVKYEARAPKKSLLLALLMKLRSSGGAVEGLQEMIEAILKKMLSPEDAASVVERLADGEDDLDIDHVVELASALLAAATGNPTTSSSV